MYIKKKLILRRNFNSKTRKKHSRVSQLIDMAGYKIHKKCFSIRFKFMSN